MNRRDVSPTMSDDDRDHDDHRAQRVDERQEQARRGEPDGDDDPDRVDRRLAPDPDDDRDAAVLVGALDRVAGLERSGLDLDDLEVGGPRDRTRRLPRTSVSVAVAGSSVTWRCSSQAGARWRRSRRWSRRWAGGARTSAGAAAGAVDGRRARLAAGGLAAADVDAFSPGSTLAGAGGLSSRPAM